MSRTHYVGGRTLSLCLGATGLASCGTAFVHSRIGEICCQRLSLLYGNDHGQAAIKDIRAFVRLFYRLHERPPITPSILAPTCSDSVKLSYLFRNLLAKSPFPSFPPCDLSTLMPWPMRAPMSIPPPLLSLCPTSSTQAKLCISLIVPSLTCLATHMRRISNVAGPPRPKITTVPRYTTPPFTAALEPRKAWESD